MARMTSLVFVLVVGSAPALAWPATVVWPTYYRTGPAKQYGVLDELQRGQQFDVLSCDGDWCRVRDRTSTGYIERGALAALPQPAGDAQADHTQVDQGKAGECIDVRLAGHTVKGQPFRVCGQPGG